MLNTKRRDGWAVRNFEQWAQNRREQLPDDPVPDDLLESSNPEVMSKWLCCYILETRQENGKPYPPKSLYGLLCGIQ